MSLPVVVDRSRPNAAVAIVGTWVALMAAILMPGNDVTDLTSLLVAAVAGAALVVVGFAAASRTRPLPPKSNARRLRAAILSLFLGMAAGGVNLAANLALANIDPAIQELLAERMVTLPPLSAIVAAPIMEEVGLRLFFMSAVAWIVQRVTSRSDVVFVIALLISSFGFALLHLDRPFPADSSLAAMYGVGLVAKYALASLLLGWVFWRWGLPYAILCHAAANALHLLLQPGFF